MITFLENIKVGKRFVTHETQRAGIVVDISDACVTVKWDKVEAITIGDSTFMRSTPAENISRKTIVEPI